MCMCMYVRVYMRMCMCMHMHYIHVYVCVCVCIYISVYEYVCACVCLCMCVHSYAPLYTLLTSNRLIGRGGGSGVECQLQRKNTHPEVSSWKMTSSLLQMIVLIKRLGAEINSEQPKFPERSIKVLKNFPDYHSGWENKEC